MDVTSVPIYFLENIASCKFWIGTEIWNHTLASLKSTNLSFKKRTFFLLTSKREGFKDICLLYLCQLPCASAWDGEFCVRLVWEVAANLMNPRWRHSNKQLKTYNTITIYTSFQIRYQSRQSYVQIPTCWLVQNCFVFAALVAKRGIQCLQYIHQQQRPSEWCKQSLYLLWIAIAISWRMNMHANTWDWYEGSIWVWFLEG